MPAPYPGRPTSIFQADDVVADTVVVTSHEPYAKRPRRTSVTTETSLTSTLSAETTWAASDIAKAGCLLGNPPKEIVFEDEEEMRRVYSLIYDVFRYKSVLNQALLDTAFLPQHPQYRNQMGHVWLLLYDLYKRRFLPRDPHDEGRRVALFERAGIQELDVTLWNVRVRLAASVARLRIKNNALKLSLLLPPHLRDERVIALDESPVTGWINSFKTSVKAVLDAVERAGLHPTKGRHDELMPNHYRLDSTCPNLLICHPGQRSELAQSALVRGHHIVLQARAFCMGPAVMFKLLGELELTGTVVQTHINSPRATAYLASLLREVPAFVGLVAFGAGDRKDEYEKYLETLRVRDVTLVAERWVDAAAESPLLNNVSAVLACPPNTYSGVLDPVSLACSRGGDIDMLQLLTDAETAGRERVVAILEEQRRTLRLAMSKPQIQIVLYETHSIVPEENSKMVDQLVDEMNLAAKERHLEEHGHSLVDLVAGEGEEGDTRRTTLDITVPDCDLFEVGKLPELCEDRDRCMKLEGEGCYLAMIRRKELVRLNATYMINIAESRGLFGGEPSVSSSKKSATSRGHAKKEASPRMSSGGGGGNRSPKGRRLQVELDRIAAPTQSSLMRQASRELDTSWQSSSSLMGQHHRCMRHHSHQDSQDCGHHRPQSEQTTTTSPRRMSRHEQDIIVNRIAAPTQASLNRIVLPRKVSLLPGRDVMRSNKMSFEITRTPAPARVPSLSSSSSSRSVSQWSSSQTTSSPPSSKTSWSNGSSMSTRSYKTGRKKSRESDRAKTPPQESLARNFLHPPAGRISSSSEERRRKSKKPPSTPPSTPSVTPPEFSELTLVGLHMPLPLLVSPEKKWLKLTPPPPSLRSNSLTSHSRLNFGIRTSSLFGVPPTPATFGDELFKGLKEEFTSYKQGVKDEVFFGELQCAVHCVIIEEGLREELDKKLSHKTQFDEQIPLDSQLAQSKEQIPLDSQLAQSEEHIPLVPQHTKSEEYIALDSQHTQSEKQIPLDSQHVQSEENIPLDPQPTKSEEYIVLESQPTQSDKQIPLDVQHSQSEEQIPLNIQHSQSEEHIPLEPQHAQSEKQIPLDSQHVQSKEYIPLDPQHMQSEEHIALDSQRTQSEKHIPIDYTKRPTESLEKLNSEKLEMLQKLHDTLENVGTRISVIDELDSQKCKSLKEPFRKASSVMRCPPPISNHALQILTESANSANMRSEFDIYSNEYYITVAPTRQGPTSTEVTPGVRKLGERSETTESQAENLRRTPKKDTGAASDTSPVGFVDRANSKRAATAKVLPTRYRHHHNARGMRAPATMVTTPMVNSDRRLSLPPTFNIEFEINHTADRFKPSNTMRHKKASRSKRKEMVTLYNKVRQVIGPIANT